MISDFKHGMGNGGAMPSCPTPLPEYGVKLEQHSCSPRGMSAATWLSTSAKTSDFEMQDNT